MNYRWSNLGKAHSLQDVLRFITKERGFTKQQMLEFLNNKNKMHNPFLFKNMDKIVEKIFYHINNDNKILIVADYDCDGVSSGYILFRTLKYLDANVEVKLPHRLYDGYGLKPKMIKYAYDNKFDLIITVDNGITAVDSVEMAKKLNIDIIITDHHQPQESLPDCLFLDAHVDGSGYPFNGLCGAGVAFKLSNALIPNFKDCSIYDDLLQICSIATIADAMDIIDENRTIVIDGLKVLNSNKQNIGIKNLLIQMGINNKEIQLDTIGFYIGPCINAAGRMDSPDKALDLLMCDDDYKSEKCAKILIELNDKRKQLQKQITNNLIINEENKCLIVEVDPGIAGIGGIIASNITEKYQKPCFVVHGENILSGSGRTIGEFPIIECLTKNEDLINGGGGHSAACGLSIDRSKLNIFQNRCNEIYSSWLINNPDLINPVIKATCEVDFTIISDRLYNNISKLKPFGNGNEEPIFISNNVEVISNKVVGKFENTIQFTFCQKFKTIKGIGFEKIKNKYIELGSPSKVNLMYKISINEWPTGIFNLQLIVVDIHLLEDNL